MKRNSQAEESLSKEELPGTTVFRQMPRVQQVLKIKKEFFYEPKRKFEELALGEKEQVIEKIAAALQRVWKKKNGANIKLIADNFNLDEIELRHLAIVLIDIALAYKMGISVSSDLGYEVELLAIAKLKSAGFITIEIEK
jgi:hypothetical protein